MSTVSKLGEASIESDMMICQHVELGSDSSQLGLDVLEVIVNVRMVLADACPATLMVGFELSNNLNLGVELTLGHLNVETRSNIRVQQSRGYRGQIRDPARYESIRVSVAHALPEWLRYVFSFHLDERTASIARDGQVAYAVFQAT